MGGGLGFVFFVGEADERKCFFAVGFIASGHASIVLLSIWWGFVDFLVGKDFGGIDDDAVLAGFEVAEFDFGAIGVHARRYIFIGIGFTANAANVEAIGDVIVCARCEAIKPEEFVTTLPTPEHGGHVEWCRCIEGVFVVAFKGDANGEADAFIGTFGDVGDDGLVGFGGADVALAGFVFKIEERDGVGLPLAIGNQFDRDFFATREKPDIVHIKAKILWLERRFGGAHVFVLGAAGKCLAAHHGLERNRCARRAAAQRGEQRKGKKKQTGNRN